MLRAVRHGLPAMRSHWSSCDWQWETELAEDWPWRDQLVAEVDGVPIGFLQIIDPAEEVSRYWGDLPPNLRAIDIWIGEAAYLGQGHGTRMMRRAIDFCFADPAVASILIDPLASNTRAIRFYQRLGFKPVEERQIRRGSLPRPPPGPRRLAAAITRLIPARGRVW